MKQSEIVKKIAAKTGMKEVEADLFIKAYHEEIAATLKNGDEVKFHGFGKFVSRKYGERKCYNPQTGKLIVLKASVQPAFIPGPKLRKLLND